MAEALGAAARTVREWAAGERFPRESAWLVIQETFGKAGLPAPRRERSVRKPRNDLAICQKELRMALRDYHLAKNQQGRYSKLRQADALARLEIAGFALERAAYSAVLGLEGKLGPEREQALQRCAALLQGLDEPMVPTSGRDASLDRVLAAFEQRRATAQATLREALREG